MSISQEALDIFKKQLTQHEEYGLEPAS